MTAPVNPRSEVLAPLRLTATGRVLPPSVREALVELSSLWSSGQLPRSSINALVKRIMPARLPADISSLPERIETKAELSAALDELMRLRRAGMIDNGEWLELQRAVEQQYGLAQQAGGKR